MYTDDVADVLCKKWIGHGNFPIQIKHWLPYKEHLELVVLGPLKCEDPRLELS